MAIAAKIASSEIVNQVTNRFAGRSFEARLIDASGATYLPGFTVDADYLALEVPLGTGGYQRQVISFDSSDVSAYTDDGVGLATKATIFAHDGGGTSIDFSSVLLVWSTGNVLTLGATGTQPAVGVRGTYTNIPIDSTSGIGVGLTVDLTVGDAVTLGAVSSAPSSAVDGTYENIPVTQGSATGLTVDLTVQNSGAATTDYILTVNTNGNDYSLSAASISDADLAALGVITAGAGSLDFSVSTVTTNTEFTLTLNKRGYDYAASDVLTILDGTLAGLGAITAGAGNLAFSVGSVDTPSNAGDILSVAETSSDVSLTAGNEAIFYWNVKQFGFYNV